MPGSERPQQDATRPPRGRGGFRGRGRGRGRGGFGYENRGKREFDRQSGSDKTYVFSRILKQYQVRNCMFVFLCLLQYVPTLIGINASGYKTYFHFYLNGDCLSRMDNIFVIKSSSGAKS